MTNTLAWSGDRTQKSRGRVLVAEDDAVNRLLLVEMLRQLGCDVVAVEDGLAAVKAASADHFDLALFDNHMPSMSGPEATRTLRTLQATHRIGSFPILACTASAMEHELTECRDAGMDAVLIKPFLIRELDGLLNRWLMP